MEWIQVGAKKINTAVVNYIEQTGDSVKIYFNSGGELDLTGSDAAGFWRILKAENALLARDAGSTTTLPKYSSSSPKPAAPSVTVHRPHVQSPASSHPHQGHSHSASHHSHSSSAVAVKKH